MRHVYLALAIVGLVVPYVFLGAFLAENGPDVVVFVDQVFATAASSFVAADVIITAVFFVGFLLDRRRRGAIANPWPYVAATILVGPSFGLPLFFWARASGRLSPSSRRLRDLGG